MTEKLLKIRFFIDYEKEEQWVNKMSQSGWHLTKYGIGYFKFEKGEPGKYIYRNELLTSINTKDNSKEYIAFLQETGVELVSKSFSWAYFRKESIEGNFELYSDTSSKLDYLNRIYYLFLFVFLLNFFIGLLNVMDFINITKTLSINDYVGFFNLLAAFIIGIPLYRVVQKRKDLKSKLDIFHD
nr:DUF2812 domain-containing protein [Lysinibacillus timonensis]